MTTQDIFNVVLAFDEATVTARTRAESDAGKDRVHLERRVGQRHG